MNFIAPCPLCALHHLGFNIPHTYDITTRVEMSVVISWNCADDHGFPCEFLHLMSVDILKKIYSTR